MVRQTYETVPPRKKISLWTPWGVQRIADLDKRLERTRRRVRSRNEQDEQDQVRREQAKPEMS